MKNLEKSLVLAAAIGIFSGCPDSKEVNALAEETLDAVRICSQHANNDAERCHARCLAGPKDCYGRIKVQAFKDCMEQK